jgi:phage gp45-like
MKAIPISEFRIPGAHIRKKAEDRKPNAKLSAFSFRLSALLLVAIPLLAFAPRAPAQDDAVTLSAAEFQRLVYSAHLHTQLAEKPELDAALQVLLELQRRNPHAEPAALAALLRETTARYRTNAPGYIRAHGTRDEVLAVYTEALRKVPARTNFVSADLVFLNRFMLEPDDHTNASPAELIHSGNRRLLASEKGVVRRQELLDACLAHAQARPAFAAAMDDVLRPETLFSLSDPPAAIIGSTNSPLGENATMQTLLALSTSSGNGSVTVSSNQLMALFSAGTETLWDTIHTNLALLAEFNLSHPDLLAYLTNQAAQVAWTQRAAAVQQGQARRVASATAAMLVQSKLMEAPDPHLHPAHRWMLQAAKHVRSVAGILDTFGNAIKTGVEAGVATYGAGLILAVPGLVSGAMDTVGLVSVLAGDEETPEAEIVREIGNIKLLIGDLSSNMNYRFDRVDRSLTTIFETLNEEFSKIEITMDAQGRQIARLHGNVDEIRRSLVDVQTVLHRLERELFIYFNDVQRNALILALNGALLYETHNPAPMSWATYSQIPDGPENTFYTYAIDLAQNAASSPSSFAPEALAGSALEQQLNVRPLDANLNYLKQFLNTSLGQSTAGSPPLSNPRDWFTSAYAYLQLAGENPMHFRTKGLRIPTIISKGENLTSFFRSLTFSGAHINWSLHNALGGCYAGKLTNFLTRVSATEQQYASGSGFALNTWRQWSASSPRITAIATEVLAVPPTSLPPPGMTNVIAIAAGGFHSLALKADGTVVGWGAGTFVADPEDFTNYGQALIPPSATNVVAIAAGGFHSLALRADGTVVGWGAGTFVADPEDFTNYGQALIPPSATNVVAIAAGSRHSLVLRADGTAVAWGDNRFGQTDIPPTATNVVAIADSLALRADGTMVAWGYSDFGTTLIPPGATNVVAIAAGGHRLALRADGTVVGWGNNFFGQTNIPPDATNVLAIAAGGGHSLALRADGTVAAWGQDYYGQAAIPPSATNVVAIAGGVEHSLLLKVAPPPGSPPVGGISFVRASIPARVGGLIQDCNSNTMEEFGRVGSLQAAGSELSGAKALHAAVLELGLPYTLERDDVLHGFLRGSEPLIDLAASRTFLERENARLHAAHDAAPQSLAEVAVLRYWRFAERLEARLNDLQATGQPEIPRLVDHTLRLLNLLRDAWTQPANSPPPALELWSIDSSPRLLLHGEPYTRYTLQYRDSLSVPGWNATTVTNWRNEQIIAPPVSSSPQRFYRALLPVP